MLKGAATVSYTVRIARIDNAERAHKFRLLGHWFI